LSKQDDALKEQLAVVTAQLLEICKAQGATTIRTPHGTISQRTEKRYWPSDWDLFFNFVKEKDAFGLLYRRINTANMEQFLEENPEVVLPGLMSEVSPTIVITKR
jgi:hypothetical protein